MKRFLPCAAALLLVAGCNLRTTTYSDEQAIPLGEGQTDSLLQTISIEYPVKGAQEEVLARIERGILTTAFDLEEAPGLRGGDRPPLRGQPQGRVFQRE